ncbi:helix-turn-helix domain-containing protein [Luteimonas sp. MJ246]|uniref:helix-turn-helix domain-containing protein n=1 Tax=Luteimonas sp. MJ174 TaxID=3129237 RepID=UPI0031BA76C8
MFQNALTSHVPDRAPSAGNWADDRRQHAAPALESLLLRWPPRVHRLEPRQALFHAGQPRASLFYVRSGCFKTSVLSEDGREKITGFRMRGDLLGLDAVDMPAHACDAVALDAAEVWELPCANLQDMLPDIQVRVTAMLAGEIRRDWRWMLALGTLGADQRVVAFLLDLSARFATMGLDQELLLLRMTRAELGNFLALTLETVTRALSRLQSRGMIEVSGRRIRIIDEAGLREVLAGDGDRCP